MRGAVALSLVSAWLSACGGPNSDGSNTGPSGAGSAAASSTIAADISPDPACAAKRAAIEASPALPGAPEAEKHRAEILGRARGASLFWRRVPKRSEDAALAEHLEKFEASPRPLAVAKGLVRRFGKSPEKLRAIFLREGYVYADDAERALALVETLRLTYLFREPTIYVLRGSALHTLTRKPKSRTAPERYVHEGGPFHGTDAELLLGDRVSATKEALSDQPIAIDLGGAVDADGAERIRVRHASSLGIVADLRYGDAWVSAVIDTDGAAARVACVDATAADLAKRKAWQAASAPWRQALSKVRETVRNEVEEGPLFDEPKDEAEGEQLDGTLRREWKRAYREGKKFFEVGSRRYDVYDDLGRPLPPQVCIDFLTDTWERASGTWYAPLPEAGEGVHADDARRKPAPERRTGGVDFDKLDLENRRSVASFVDFAKKHPELFEVWDVPESDRVPLLRRQEFFAALEKNADQWSPGDMLVIFGTKADGTPHYHSVLVLDRDPVSGVVMLVAGNAGRPREQTLEGVMARSPKRFLKHRIRPNPLVWGPRVLGTPK